MISSLDVARGIPLSFCPDKYCKPSHRGDFHKRLKGLNSFLQFGPGGPRTYLDPDRRLSRACAVQIMADIQW